MIQKQLFLSLLLIGTLWAEKIEVTSKTMEADELTKEVHFIGDANVTKLGDWIHGDEIIVYFDENNETKQYDAIGSVTFSIVQNEVHYVGQSDKLTYFPKKSEYVLTGNAVIDDLTNKRHVNGDKIVLDSLTGKTKVDSEGKKPVKFIIDMGEK